MFLYIKINNRINNLDPDDKLKLFKYIHLANLEHIKVNAPNHETNCIFLEIDEENITTEEKKLLIEKIKQLSRNH